MDLLVGEVADPKTETHPRAFLEELLACPGCKGRLAKEPTELVCAACGIRYPIREGIPDLRKPGDVCSEVVRRFYDHAPFPGYPPQDDLGQLRARAGRSEFAQMLDQAIPRGARVLEMGCGTGQMSLFLASGNRQVVGADLTRASLVLGAQAARRFEIGSVQFVETDLLAPGLRPAAFDVVYCSGVLHHTRDPRASFASIVQLVRPGGMVVLGLYSAYARLPHRLRRFVARMTRYKWIPFDPVLRSRLREPARSEAWLRDQYQHPEEHRHTLREVLGWFENEGVDYVRSYPAALLGSEAPEHLFEPEIDRWALEHVLTQLGWMFSLAHEGGLFVTIGRRAGGHPSPSG